MTSDELSSRAERGTKSSGLDTGLVGPSVAVVPSPLGASSLGCRTCSPPHASLLTSHFSLVTAGCSLLTPYSSLRYSRSLTASPSSVAANTTSTNAMPGAVATHGAFTSVSRPDAIKLPHEGVGG